MDDSCCVEKELFNGEKTLSAAADNGCTNNTKLHVTALIGTVSRGQGGFQPIILFQSEIL